MGRGEGHRGGQRRGTPTLALGQEVQFEIHW